MIPQLEDLSIRQRIILTVIIIIILLLVMAMVEFWTGRWEAEGQNISRSKLIK
jgi:CHASE3 domain sensor protein